MPRYYALVVWAVLVSVLTRQTTAVSHGRMRNVVVQCAEYCKDGHAFPKLMIGCNLCQKHLTLDSKHRASSCLDVESSGRVIMQKCELNIPTQNWTYLPNTHQLRNVYRCLDVSEDHAVVKECDASKASQRWDFNATSKHLQSSDGHRCLDSTREIGDASNVTVAVSHCSDSENKLWLMEPLRSLDMYGAGSRLSDEEWAEKRTCNRQPAVDGNDSVLDPDGDRYSNFSAAQIVYPQTGRIWGGGGHACTPLELLPTDDCEGRFEGKWQLSKAASLPKIKDIVKKIYYINVDWSDERRKIMDAHLDRFGVPYERFSAVDAANVEKGLYDEEIARTGGVVDNMRGNYGTIACSLSHRHLYRKILEEDPDGDGIYIVMEDDIMLNDDWQEHLALLLKNIPDDWNAIIGAWCCNLRCTDLVNEHMAHVLSPMLTEGSWPALWYGGSGMVVLSPRRLRPLMERLDTSPVEQSDVILTSINGTRTYAPVRQMASDRFGLGSDRKKADDAFENAVEENGFEIFLRGPDGHVRNSAPIVACLSAVACIVGVFALYRRYKKHVAIKIHMPQIEGGVDGECGNYNGVAEDDDPNNLEGRHALMVDSSSLLFQDRSS